MTRQPTAGNGTDRPLLERMPTGITGLDTILQGGFMRGGVNIIQGQPGAGKTILGNQICFSHVAGGGRALYVTLLAESHSRMLAHIGQLSFFDQSVIPEGVYYVSAFRVLEEEGLKGLLALLRREVQQRGASLLILDGLVAAEESAGSPREYKKFVHELQTQASLTDCTMLLLTSASATNIPEAAEHTMVDGVVELKSQLYGRRAERHLQVHKRRGAAFLHGQHSYRITDQGVVVYPRFEALFDRPSGRQRLDPANRLSIGVKGLDEMLGGGLARTTSTIVVGPMGIGKTSIGLHFLSGCSADEPGLFLGFHEMPEALQVQATDFGLPVARLIDEGAVEVIWQPATEGILDEVCALLLEAVRRRGVRRLFVDGIDGFTDIAADNHRVKHAITALANELRTLGVTTLWTAQVDVGGSNVGMPISGLALQGLSPIAENTILLRFVEVRSELHRMVSVLKARLSSIERTLRCFVMTNHGIVVDAASGKAEAVLAELSPGKAARPLRSPPFDGSEA